MDLAILETGLGGRLDATSAADAKLVAITPIAMDHEKHLGDTITKIAAEKAAIIRPGTLAVVAPQEADVMQVILLQANKNDVAVKVDDWKAEVIGVSDIGRLSLDLQTPNDSMRICSLDC